MRRPLWIAALLGVAAAGAALALASTRGDSKPPDLPVLGELPAFDFTDQRGEPLTDGDLRGQVTIANVIFTRCPTVCPVTTMKMRRIEERTEDLGERLGIVSFSVDPSYDTPARLAAFATEHDADTERWSFVTGPEKEIRERIQGSLKLAIDRQGEFEDGTPNIVHGTHFVLLDRDLRIRGFYSSSDEERLDALVEHARFLARPEP